MIWGANETIGWCPRCQMYRLLDHKLLMRTEYIHCVVVALYFVSLVDIAAP